MENVRDPKSQQESGYVRTYPEQKILILFQNIEKKMNRVSISLSLESQSRLFAKQPLERNKRGNKETRVIIISRQEMLWYRLFSWQWHHFVQDVLRE